MCRFIGLDLLATINWEAHQHVHHGNLMHPQFQSHKSAQFGKFVAATQIFGYQPQFVNENTT